jgi:GNAT superfamily N-acetyltransferase
LWLLRIDQLAENGITVENEIPGAPDLDSPYETDYHRIERVYLSGRGNFWIAWLNQEPVGHLGAEDRGDYIELRRMFVKKDCRNQGIGTKLVKALIEHCCKKNIDMIRLWTSSKGPGCYLYQKLGFVHLKDETGSFVTDKDEIRMFLEL